MDLKLLPASPEHRHIIQNLVQFYIYDFSPYVDYDVEENGLFKNYPGLEDYWTDKTNRFPYIIKSHDKYIGFVLVRSETTQFSIAEFFIMKKYRRKGIGKSMIKNLKHLAKTYFKIELIHIEIVEGNPIHSLLLKMDFHEFGRQDRFFKEGDTYLGRVLLESHL